MSDRQSSIVSGRSGEKGTVRAKLSSLRLKTAHWSSSASTMRSIAFPHLSVLAPCMLQKVLLNHPVKPFVVSKWGCVLMVDISGFTAVTEEMQRERHSADEITFHVNAYFDYLITRICANGGDVVQFCGDAIICAFEAPTEDMLPSVTCKTLACAMTLFDTYDVPKESGGSISLQVHIGGGCGLLNLHVIGNEKFGWQCFLAGTGTVQALKTVDSSKRGQIAVSAAMWEMVSSSCSGIPHPTAEGIWVIQSVMDTPQDNTDRLAPPSSLGAQNEAALSSHLAMFVPQCAVGMTGGELRTVTTVFLKLSGLDQVNLNVEQLRSAVNILFEEADVTGGMINKILFDDKGISALVLWGTPGYTHEDDSTKAHLFCNSVAQTLPFPIHAGITRQKIFCGITGSSIRKEYTVLGSAVNMANRMMSVAFVTTPNESTVLCDQNVHDQAQHDVVFAAATTLAVKGGGDIVTYHAIRVQEINSPMNRSMSSRDSSASPVPLRKRNTNKKKKVSSHEDRRNDIESFVDGLETDDSVRLSSERLSQASASSPKIIVIGRDVELSRVQEVLDASNANASSWTDRCLLISGDAGIGKTTILHQTIALAMEQGFAVLYFEGHNQNNPFQAISGYISDILRVLPVSQVRMAMEVNGLSCMGMLQQFIEDYAQDDDIEQTTSVQDLMIAMSQLLALSASARGDATTLVAVDDGNKVDEVSLQVILNIIQRSSSSCLVITSRSGPGGRNDETCLSSPSSPQIPQDISPQDKYLKSDAESVWEKLDNCSTTLIPLDKISSKELYQSLLSVQTVESVIVESIYSKSDGNPGVAEELLSTALESGVIEIKHDVARIAKGHSVVNLEISSSIQSVIIQRFDAILSPERKMILRCASVIGNSFPDGLILQLVGNEVPAHLLQDELFTLQRLGFFSLPKRKSLTRNLESATGLVYTFKLNIMRECIYSLVPGREKVRLHAKIGALLDAAHGAHGDVTDIVHHYVEGHCTDKALFFLNRAAKIAFNKRHFAETAMYCNRVLILMGNTIERNDEVNFMLLVSLYSCGDLNAMRVVLKKLLDNHPQTSWQFFIRTLVEHYRRVFSSTYKNMDRTDLETQCEVYRIYSLVSYINGDIRNVKYCSLKGCNLASATEEKSTKGFFQSIRAMTLRDTDFHTSCKTLFRDIKIFGTSTWHAIQSVSLMECNDNQTRAAVIHYSKSDDHLTRIFCDLNSLAYSYLTGDPKLFDERCNVVSKRARQFQDLRSEMFVTVFQLLSTISVSRGDPRSLETMLKHQEVFRRQDMDDTFLNLVLVVRALMRVQGGKLVEAFHIIQRVEWKIPPSGFDIPSLFHVATLIGIMDVQLAILASTSPTSTFDTLTIRKSLTLMCRHLALIGKVIPIADSYGLVYDALRVGIADKDASKACMLMKGIKEVNDFHRYVKNFGLLMLAEFGACQDKDDLINARPEFERMGCKSLLDRVDKLGTKDM